MDLQLVPNIGEIIVRSKARIGRLDAAIVKEKGKKAYDKDRLLSLQAERTRRAQELKLFIEDIPDANG